MQLVSRRFHTWEESDWEWFPRCDVGADIETTVETYTYDVNTMKTSTGSEQSEISYEVNMYI